MLRLLIAPILSIFLSLGLTAEAIDEYRTMITVHPSGTLHIEEVIRYDFGTLQRHGIFRDIPLTVKVDRYAPEVPVGLDHFTVTADEKLVPFTHSTIRSDSGGKMMRYRIGDPNKTLTGRHTYALTYDAARGVYPSSLSNMDAIRWNAVGSGSNVPTHHAVADLILPDIMDRSQVRIHVYTGKYGSTDASRAHYHWIDDHHVQFEVSDLAPHEALTVEANYPEGMLGQNTDALKSTWLDRLLGNWHWGAIAGFFLFLWRYAKRFGAEDRSGSVAPQYYPPKGLSLLQSGLLLDKFADKKDFAAAILELGTLGYLEVHQSGGDTPPIIRRTDKVHATDELTADQTYLLDQILFKNRDMYVIKTQDTGRAERINTQLDHVNEMLYNWSVSDGQMRANPEKTRKQFLIRVGVIAVVLSIAAFVTTLIYHSIDLAVLSVAGSIFVGVGLFMLLGSIRTKAYFGIFFGAVWLIFTLIIFGGIASEEMSFSTLFRAPIILLPFVLGGTWYYYRRIGLFSPKGLETYRYLLGYRDFMQKVEQDRIRRFLKQDPDYLDRGLPYAVLLGVNKHWIEFYETLNVPQPSWYHGHMHDMNDFSQSVERQSIAPASESGGFSGGGSFSGGGGGGGGVGSW
jgi:uncharacterized membrane protein YgcG